MSVRLWRFGAPWGLLVAGSLVACVPRSAPPLTPVATVEIPKPSAGDSDQQDPDAPAKSDACRQLAGRWAFTHDGEPWFEADVTPSGETWDVVLRFDDAQSWVRFEITEIAIDTPEPGTVLLRGVDLDGSGDSREIELRWVGEGLCEGTVFGDNYDRPFPVRGERGGNCGGWERGEPTLGGHPPHDGGRRASPSRIGGRQDW